MILSKAYEEKIITKEEASKLWDNMLNEGLKLPEKSFHNYYNKLYKKDCEEFLNRTLYD